MIKCTCPPLGVFVKIFVLCFFCFKLCAFSPLSEGIADHEPKLMIHNRILVTVMDKPISVLDVVKKMNVILEQHYPEYKNLPEAKFQFYSQQWKSTLKQMIDTELMLKDAEKLELKITDSEIREQIHLRFGPNIMKSLSSIGISYDEAQTMIKSELITQRMMWHRVHAKALSEVVPQEIKKSYQTYVSENPASNLWTYEVLSVRTEAQDRGTQLAHKAYDMLNAAKLGLKEAALALNHDSNKDQSVHITVSDVITTKERELSSSHKEVLKTLNPGDYSPPIEQQTKHGTDKVYRVFHLIDLEKKEPEEFTNMAESFKDKLIQEKVDRFNHQYLTKLRSLYGFDNLYWLEKLEPFSLQP